MGVEVHSIRNQATLHKANEVQISISEQIYRLVQLLQYLRIPCNKTLQFFLTEIMSGSWTHLDTDLLVTYFGCVIVFKASYL